MEIRPAGAGDWPAIWPIVSAVAAAGETYALPDPLTPQRAERLWFEPGFCVLVAVVAGQVVGTAKYGPNRPGRGSHVATASFMVAPHSSGRGVGRALAERVLAEATEAGFSAMQFNAVVESNTAAVRLWQGLGFRIIGTVPEAFDHAQLGRVGLHVMHRALAG